MIEEIVTEAVTYLTQDAVIEGLAVVGAVGLYRYFAGGDE